MINALFLVLLIGATVVFSIQNAGGITASFLVWRFDISVSTITVAAILAGIIVAHLLRGLMTKRKKARST